MPSPNVDEGRERFNPIVSFVPPARIMPTRRFTPSELERACSRLDVDHALLLLARISRRISMPPHRDQSVDRPANALRGAALHLAFQAQRTCVEWTMNDSEINRLKAYAAESDRPPFVYFRAQLLEFLRWLAHSHSTRSIANYSKTQISHERSRFLFSVLCAGEVWSSRTFREVSTDTGGPLTSRRQDYLLSFRHGREASATVANTYYPLARSSIIFGAILPRLLGSFSTSFRETTGLSYEQFLNCQALFWAMLINEENEWAHLDLQGLQSRPYGHSLQRFLCRYAQPLSTLATTDQARSTSEMSCLTNRLRALRKRPILLTSDGNHAAVPDTLIFAEFVSVGPLFEILQPANQSTVFDCFGRAVEEYCGGILRRAYPPTSRRLARRLYQNASGASSAGNFEVDAHVTSGRSAAILEVKASFLSEDVMEGNARFFARLTNRYVSAEGGRPKGVKQLARIVEAICSNEWLGEEDEFNAVARLFPVLVVLDDQLDNGLVGRFLAEEFAKQFGVELNDRDGGFRRRGRWVAHLMVLTVGTLEELEESLHCFSLLGMMEDYAEAHPDRLLSVRNYVVTSDYSNQLRPNRHLAAASGEIFRRASVNVSGE